MDQKSVWRQALAEMRTVHYGQDTARGCGGWRSPSYPAEETHMKNAVYILGTPCQLHQKIGVEQCSLWGLLLVSTHTTKTQSTGLGETKWRLKLKKEKKRGGKKGLCLLSESIVHQLDVLTKKHKPFLSQLCRLSHHFSRAMEILRAKSAAVARKEDFLVATVTTVDHSLRRSQRRTNSNEQALPVFCCG